MSINEDLVAPCVPEAASLLLVAEQGVREPGERAELGLVALSTDVDDDSLTAGQCAVVTASSRRRTLARRVADRRQLQRRPLAPPCLLVFATTSSTSSLPLPIIKEVMCFIGVCVLVC